MCRIDVHHHFFPPDLDKPGSNQKMGWKTPPGTLPWSPCVSLEAMDAAKIDIAILSLPAQFTGSVCEENRATARKRNLYAASIVREHPTRFGFFATLPFPDDVEGCLAEIAHAFDVLQADGVALSSSCSDDNNRISLKLDVVEGYIGDDLYDAIWEDLHRRKAVVFLHGAQVPSVPLHVHLPVPISEVPNETYKAAAQIVVTGKKRKYHNVKIILAHLGGATPFLAPRVAVLSNYMGCPLTPEEILEDFKAFYYETALSAYSASLVAMDAFTQPEQIMFGTDFPAVNLKIAGWYTKNVEDHYADNTDKLEMIMNSNAFKLFPRLKKIMTKSK